MKAVIEVTSTLNSFFKPIDNNLNPLPLTEATSHLYFIRNYKAIFKSPKELFNLNRKSTAKDNPFIALTDF
jgi:hypothetical protein